MFQSHLHHCGIEQRLACPYTPNQNGTGERKHRHVTGTGLTLLFHSNAPSHLWVEAFSTASYIINRLPTPVLNGISPYECLYGKPPSYVLLRTFGCLCFPYLKDYAPHKLSPKSLPCIFIGYSPLHQGFRCLDRRTQRVYISCHVIFDESNFPFAGSPLPSPTSLSDLLSFPDTISNPSTLSSDSSFSLSSSNPSPSSSRLPCALEPAPVIIPFMSSDPPVEPPTSNTFAHDLSPSPAIASQNSSGLFPSTPVSPRRISVDNSHPMVTRSKAGIFKPRAYHSLTIGPVTRFHEALFSLKEP